MIDCKVNVQLIVALGLDFRVLKVIADILLGKFQKLRISVSILAESIRIPSA